MKALRVAWNILLKDMKTYYLKPPNISWGILFPLAWMLMMFLKTNGTLNIAASFPGIIALSIIFGTTSMLAVTITFERKSRSFERLLIAPISIELFILAKTTGAILFGIFNSLLPILLSVFYFHVSVNHWGVLSLGVVLLSVISTLLGLFISVSSKEVFEAQTYSNFFRFPIIFLSGLFVPIAALPLILKPLAFILPVTYGVDIIRYASNGSNIFSVALNMIIISVFCLFLFYVSIFNIKRKWIL